MSSLKINPETNTKDKTLFSYGQFVCAHGSITKDTKSPPCSLPLTILLGGQPLYSSDRRIFSNPSRISWDAGLLEASDSIDLRQRRLMAG
eukprot:m.191024 g.191024  ORF g.191024 m.191024 type:complete len:90 (+) comp39439_c2_seq20:188-457(+)